MSQRQVAIAVDGPGSSGKGTVARAVAQALGYQYVDTGAMYRSVALMARRRAIPWTDERRVAALARDLVFVFGWDGGVLRVQVDGEDVTDDIRMDAIGRGASDVSRLPAVRAALLGLQRALGAQGGVVMDGRDIGTVVLPDADVKIYLDAGLDERARRRHAELVARGETSSYRGVREALAARDHQDMNRAVAPLRAASDAVRVDSTSLTPEQVTEQVLRIVAERVGAISLDTAPDAR